MDKRCGTCAWWIRPRNEVKIGYAPCSAPIPAGMPRSAIVYRVSMALNEGTDCQTWKEATDATNR